MSTFIYTLSDPFTKKVRYVGKSDDPKRRYIDHMAWCGKEKTYKGNWLSSLKRKGASPILDIVEKTSQEKWEDSEKMWIEFFLNQGCRLTNLTKGGDGFYLAEKTNKKRIESIRKTKSKQFPITIQICLSCKKEFRIYYSKVKTSQRKYCSRACHSITKKGQKPHNFLGMIEKCCILCNGIFSVPTYNNDRKFCSVSCYHSSLNGRVLSEEIKFKQSIGIKKSWENKKIPKIKKNCEQCNSLFEYYPIESRRFCSRKCYSVFFKKHQPFLITTKEHCLPTLNGQIK